MKAILRSWDRDISFIDTEIKVANDYDFSKGPHDPVNEDRCPVVGSNQEILDEARQTMNKTFRAYCNEHEYMLQRWQIVLAEVIFTFFARQGPGSGKSMLLKLLYDFDREGGYQA